MITTKIVFDHRGRAKLPNDIGPVEVRVIYDRKPYYINTGIRVRRSQFINGKIANIKEAKTYNEAIEIIVGKISKEVVTMLDANQPIDVAEIRRRVWNVESKNDSFLKWITEETAHLNLKHGTMKHYKSLIYRLNEFARMRSWSDITVAKIYEYDAFLHTLTKQQTKTDVDAGRPAKQISQNTIHNYHKDLKAMLSRALKIGLIQSNPYDKLKGQFKRVDKDNIEYLTRSEMLDFEKIKVEPGSLMEASKDLFIFQLYTGMSYADTQVFDIADYRQVDGRWLNIGQRVKTGVAYVSMLLAPAVEVLKKYNMRTPKMSVQVYNRNLKTLGAMARIERPIHSHMARHTFATWMLSEGAKIENVSRMLGHTNITQTQRYAKVLAKSVQSDFDMIANKLKTQNEHEKDNDLGCSSSAADSM